MTQQASSFSDFDAVNETGSLNPIDYVRAQACGLSPCEDLTPDVAPYRGAAKDYRFGGFKGSVYAWARYTGISKGTLRGRLTDRLMSFDTAVQIGRRGRGRPFLVDPATYGCGTEKGFLRCARKAKGLFSDMCSNCQAKLREQMVPVNAEYAGQKTCVFQTEVPRKTYWFFIQGEYLNLGQVSEKFGVRYSSLVAHIKRPEFVRDEKSLQGWLLAHGGKQEEEEGAIQMLDLDSFADPGREAFETKLAFLTSQGWVPHPKMKASPVHGPVLCMPRSGAGNLCAFKHSFYSVKDLAGMLGMHRMSLAERLRQVSIDEIVKIEYLGDVHPALLGNICSQRNAYFVRESKTSKWQSLASWIRENTEFTRRAVTLQIFKNKLSLNEIRARANAAALNA